MHQQLIQKEGREVSKDSKVLILLHGRGGNARDILTLGNLLAVKDFALLAPDATNHSWYPYSFMAPVQANEPWLSSALELVKGMVDELMEAGIPSKHIYLAGFSQGACLTLEFAARHAREYGGIIAFTGGLIGEQLAAENYQGDFAGTPLFIGSADPDPHVPVTRVQETVDLYRKLNANVKLKIYPGMGHTISMEEIEGANLHVLGKGLE